MNEFHIRRGQDQKEAILNWLRRHLKTIYEVHDRAELTIKPWKEKRSLSANGLYWIWCTEAASYLVKHGHTIEVEFKGVTTKRPINKNDFHDMMRKTFLGVETKQFNGDIITKLRSTKSLNSAEFCHYMTEVNGWCYEALGLLLPDPQESEYRKYMNKQRE